MLFGKGGGTSDKDFITELKYRWKKRLVTLPKEEGLKELRAELRRFVMTPERIAQDNKERAAHDGI